MVELKASKQDILEYLKITTDWMRRRDQGLFGYYGIYGFIDGEFYDSMGLGESGNFTPQRRPWYQTAIQSGRTIAYTAPYEDRRTGNTIISAVRNIDIKNGDIAGILSIDINIRWLTEYMGSLKLSPGGYGMLLNRGMTILTHPDNIFTGSQLQDLGKSYDEAARTLRAGQEVFARRIIDINGNSAIVFIRQIFNGWYVCIITPYSEFYRDLNVSAIMLILLGIVLSLSLCFILLRLSAAKMRADEDSKSKSSFLASMSHEIRTPMNAITGMAELLLRGELSDEARAHAQDIKHAGNNLVSIINDILDFSKIEAGKLEIVSSKYVLASLVNDSVNIIRMRIGEKHLRFFTNIDGNIPNSLIGDEVRMRQILLNLLSNAVKYSEKGHIGLFITVQKRDDKQVWLRIAVIDTGRGIKKEDQKKLFSEFVQIDVMQNRGIEGTGLGLAITRRLCHLMGGDITVESEYGKGTVFTVVIPQGIDSPEPFAMVSDAEKKKVLVYEGRAVYAKALCWSLENMGVPYLMVANHDDFTAALYREEWFYVFSGYGLYEKIKPVMDKPDTAFIGGKKPPLALMVEWGTEDYIHNVRFASIPVQSLSIANILNGRADSKGYNESSGTIRFRFSRARLLVVDDISTNLKVAEGLIAPYMAAVDTCLSGRQAIEMVKKQNYDMVLMDHMMPEMDGIETTAVIRSWEKEQQKKDLVRHQIPIIALTANAVVGMREIFIQNGFDDFLAKPIDVSKLDEVLNRWIPEEKREKGVGSRESGIGSKERSSDNNFAPGLRSDISNRDFPLPDIPGIDTKKGIAMTGGTLSAYRQVLSLFCKDVKERLPLLQKTAEADTLNAFVTHVHALKSASASIGAAEISAQAAGLEAVGKAGDSAFIRESVPAFSQQLTELIGGIDAALKTDNAAEQIVQTTDDSAIVSLLCALKPALETQKTFEIDRILDELGKSGNDGIQPAMEQISDKVLIAEYGNAVEILDGLLKERGFR
jgi:signal transduction histidine kinase/CheY-like chemotaxis protein/HPt (histidine-containing phosphotransfer) domain-containing protein